METYVNKAKDSYLWLIHTIEDHPHQVFWIGLASLFVTAWFF